MVVKYLLNGWSVNKGCLTIPSEKAGKDMKSHEVGTLIGLKDFRHSQGIHHFFLPYFTLVFFFILFFFKSIFPLFLLFYLSLLFSLFFAHYWARPRDLYHESNGICVCGEKSGIKKKWSILDFRLFGIKTFMRYRKFIMWNINEEDSWGCHIALALLAWM